MMTEEDAEEFTQSLGQIVGGSWRQLALAEKMGVPKALGLSLQDWVTNRLGGYVRLTISERREAAVELIESGMSKHKAAEVLGVSRKTVQRDIGTNVPPPTEETLQSGTNVPDNGEIVHEPVTSDFRNLVETRFERWLARWSGRDNDVASIIRRYCGKRAPTRWVLGRSKKQIENKKGE